MPTEKLLTHEWADYDGGDGQVISDDDGKGSPSLEARSASKQPFGRWKLVVADASWNYVGISLERAG